MSGRGPEHQWLEDLATWALSAFDRAERRAWLDEVEQADGKEVADDLKARMRRIYREQKQHQQRK